MDGNRSLTDIARSVLVDNPASDGKCLREKAGLVALLNLLGIVESFYGDATEGAAKEPDATGPSSTGLAVLNRPPPAPGPDLAPATESASEEPESPSAPPPVTPAAPAGSEPVAPANQSNPVAPAPTPPMSPDNPLSLIGGLARMLGSLMGAQATGVPASSSPAQPSAAPSGPAAGASGSSTGASASNTGGGLAGLLGGLDPAMITSLIGVASAAAKLWPQIKPPTRVTATEAAPPAAADGGNVEFPSGPSDDNQAQPQEKPASGAHAPVSPLQQILGIDPRVLTIILNLVADLMKNRPADDRKNAAGAPAPVGTASGSPIEAGNPVADQPAPAQPAPAQPAPGPGPAAPLEATGSPAGREPATPPVRRIIPPTHRHHRPGLGIYRGALGASRPIAP